MDYHYTNQGRRKTPIARSVFMRAEEIDRERAMSGWNPYEGEEETEEMHPGMQMPRETRPQGWENEERYGMGNPTDNGQAPEGQMQPYFQQPDFTQILEEQREEERDFRKLQSMYPEAAKILMPYIEEECDKLEYEGSAMFDEYPDRTTVRRIQERVRDQVQEQFPQGETVQPDEMLSMQYQGRGGRRPGQNWLEDVIQVMLLHEMHHRRCRHRRCRRNRY